MADIATSEMAHPKALQHHFDSLQQQSEVASLGMWIFLVTEVLFFGGMFTSYLVYRSLYPTAFAIASKHTVILIGAVNTAVLITSSLTMALGVFASQENDRRGTVTFLTITWLLGLTFLVLKGVEYTIDFKEHLVPGANFFVPGVNEGHAQLFFSLYFIMTGIHAQHAAVGVSEQLFFSLYFIMTGIHAAHMVVGIGIMLVILAMAWKKRFSPAYYGPVEVSGLYWHFVDIVWIFLFPLLYLLGAHLGASH